MGMAVKERIGKMGLGYYGLDSERIGKMGLYSAAN